MSAVFKCGYCQDQTSNSQVELAVHCVEHFKETMTEILNTGSIECPMCRVPIGDHHHVFAHHRYVCFWCLTDKPDPNVSMHPECDEAMTAMEMELLNELVAAVPNII